VVFDVKKTDNSGAHCNSFLHFPLFDDVRKKKKKEEEKGASNAWDIRKRAEKV
jgi:hypothetical protein